MAYNPIAIDYNNLTLMGVSFPDRDTLTRTANALGSNMFEGFEPTTKGITIIRDYITDKITITDVIQLAKDRMYA
jgi:putative transcriptional regulator